MKTIIRTSILVISILFLNAKVLLANTLKIDSVITDYADVTNLLSTSEFKTIKNTILTYGDRNEVFSQMYGALPHYFNKGLDYYLIPEIGQSNIKGDPSISDFNKIVIRDTSKLPQYYVLQIVRPGDLAKPLVHTIAGMQEEKVYLINYYNDDMTLLTANLLVYLLELKLLKAATAVSKISKNIAKLVKNPADEILQIKTENDLGKIESIDIVDLRGSVVRVTSSSKYKNIININISQIPSGLYVCKLKFSGKQVNLKFIKQ